MLLVVVCGWFVFSFNGVEDDQNISATISPPVLLGKSKVRGEILLKRSVLTQNYQDGETTKNGVARPAGTFPKPNTRQWFEETAGSKSPADGPGHTQLPKTPLSTRKIPSNIGDSSDLR